jgi:hypothetical protein
MKFLVLALAMIIIIGWAMGVFIYSLMGLIHLLILFAIVTLFLGIKRKA